jgi:hypothetical protein
LNKRDIKELSVIDILHQNIQYWNILIHLMSKYDQEKF